jgi:uncharacterized membrane protein YhaH (DUF805 family)
MDNPYQAPRGDIHVPPAAAPKTWKEILFSFEGRIPRRTYWAASLLMGLIFGAIFLVVFLLANEKVFESAAFLFLIPVWLALVYCSIAVSVKRWHDRNKSGWWWFIGAIPYIGSIWTFIENGCLRGTMGPNNYGEDPT